MAELYTLVPPPYSAASAQPPASEPPAELADPSAPPPAAEASVEVLAKIDEVRSTVEAARSELAGVAGRVEETASAVARAVGALGTVEAKVDQGQASLNAFAARAAGELHELSDTLARLETRAETKLDTFEGKLDASSARSEGKLDALGGKVDALGGKVDSSSAATHTRLDAIKASQEKAEARQEKTHAKVDAVAGCAARSEGKIDTLHAKQEKTDGKIDRLTRGLWGVAGVMALGFAALLFVSWRHATPNPGQVTENGMTRGGVAEEGSQWWMDPYGSAKGSVPGLRANLGQRKTGRPMPDHPLPHQAKAPCIAGASTLLGVCWLEIANQKPPCLPGFYSYGTSCYAPLAEDPTQPVGEPPPSSNPEGR